MDPARATSLLQRYTRDRSEDAFRALVDGYAGMVYATALRRTGGNTALAEDATQMTFIALARRASRIRGGDHLPPWLHLAATRHAISLMRSESARHHREKIAHVMHQDPDTDSASNSRLLLLLDDSLLSLPYEDRRLLTLRYLEGWNLRAVGEAEGISENAAGKRVHKALQKLRDRFARTGESVPVERLASLIALPPGLAIPAETTNRFASTALAASRDSFAFHIIAMTNSTKWVAGAAVLLTLGAGGVVAYKSSSAPADEKRAAAGNVSLPAASSKRAREERPDSSTAFRQALEACSTEPESDFDDRAFFTAVRLLGPVSADELRQELRRRERTETFDGIEKRYQGVLVTAWTRKDPKAALDHTLRRTEEVDAESVKSELACNAWIEQAPAEALDWLGAITPEERRLVAIDSPILAITGALANKDYEAVSRFLDASDGTEWFNLPPMNIEDIEQSLDEEGREEFHKLLKVHQ